MGLAAKKLDEKPVYERLNVTKLAFRFDLDRGTVRDRIQKNGIEPVESKRNESIYELTPKLEVVLSKISSPLDEAKLRTATADAELKEAKLLQMRGDLVQHQEVVETVQQIFGALYRKIAVQQPPRLLGKIRKAKTQAEAEKAWKNDTSKIFQALKDDFEAILK